VSSAASIRVGGIYSVDDGAGHYGVAKLLAHENGIYHVRLYKQTFPVRPAALDIGTLSLGTAGEPEFGIGHLPIREAEFLHWQPVLIASSTVTAEELESCDRWKQAGGGVF
jgi:hypothetical protein